MLNVLRVAGLELNHKSRIEGNLPSLDQEMEKTLKVIDLQTYEKWKSSHA